MTEQRCKRCGCTQNDCRRCIERTGFACRWVEKDLCSACATPTELNNGPWAPDELHWDTEGATTGMPGLMLFANALQVWSTLQHREITVAEAARAFCVLPQRIAEAVTYHPWMFLHGPRDDYTKMLIEHDGE